MRKDFDAIYAVRRAMKHARKASRAGDHAAAMSWMRTAGHWVKIAKALKEQDAREKEWERDDEAARAELRRRLALYTKRGPDGPPDLSAREEPSEVLDPPVTPNIRIRRL